jgi:hypothetical protein
MFTAPTTVGRDGNSSESVHSAEVLALLEPVLRQGEEA